MRGTIFGQRLVFGLVTLRMYRARDAGHRRERVRELGMTGIRFTAPVYHGDTLYAYSEVLEKRDADRADAGIVRFKHWGTKQDGTVVFEGERTVLIKRRSHWGNR